MGKKHEKNRTHKSKIIYKRQTNEKKYKNKIEWKLVKRERKETMKTYKVNKQDKYNGTFSSCSSSPHSPSFLSSYREEMFMAKGLKTKEQPVHQLQRRKNKR